MATNITGHVVNAETQEVQDQLEVLVEQLSFLADAKRMYGSVRPAPGSRHTWPLQSGARPTHTGTIMGPSPGDLNEGPIAIALQGRVAQVPGQVHEASTAISTTIQCTPDPAPADASVAGGSFFHTADAATATARKEALAVPSEQKPESAAEVDVEALLQQADVCSS
ncbi:hypothetical protein VaNZ11_003721, partial [Volvox africanus]